MQLNLQTIPEMDTNPFTNEEYAPVDLLKHDHFAWDEHFEFW